MKSQIPETIDLTHIDHICDRFEAAWRSGAAPSLEDFLDGEVVSVEDASRRGLLIELIRIDLEWRWRLPSHDTVGKITTFVLENSSAPPTKQPALPPHPRVEDYLAAFPELGPFEETLIGLVEEEYRARRSAGDQANRDEFLARFRQHASALTEALDRVDQKLAATGADSASKAAEPVRLGKFQLLEAVGEGGFGTVYRARDTELNRTVAIKLPRFGAMGGEAQRERFLREARAAAQLRHPHICPVYEVGRSEQQMFIALGFIEGQDLRKWSIERRLTARESAELVAKIARAVHYAHEHGVIHRDIKPANVVMDTASGEPVLMDFGLAKQLDDAEGQLTQSGDVMGTPAYMAPEQAAGRLEQIGRTTDVYSLGALLYELVAGKPPFEGTVGEILVKVQSESPLPLRKRAPQAHQDLETICLKAMRKEPPERYATAAELADDLERFTAGEAILARREGPLRRVIRRVRRRPLQSFIVVLAATAVLAGVLLARHGLATRWVGEQLALVEAELDRAEFTGEQLERIDRMIGGLQRSAPDRAEAARSRLSARFAEVLQEKIRRPRLEDAEIGPLRSAIALLAARDSEAARGLEEELSRRAAQWQQLFVLSSPFANVGRVLEAPSVRVERQRLLRSPSGQKNLRLLTQVTCPGHVQLEADFDASWQAAGGLGLLLNATAADGYQFRLVQDETPAAGPDLSELGEMEVRSPLALEISRGEILLRREPVEPGDIPGNLLRLRARREGSRLSLWLNERSPLIFEDAFPMSPAEPGVFGLLLPQGVGVVRLAASQQNVSSAASPLERADASYSDARFAEALAVYQALGDGAADARIRAEAQYKAAMCLVGLDRPTEAEKLLLALAAEPGERWPALAAVQLWVLKVRGRDLQAADAVYDTLSNRFDRSQVLLLLPHSLRREITDRYVAQVALGQVGGRISTDLLRQARRAIEVADMLGDDKDSQNARLALQYAYEHLGDIPRALAVGNEIAARLPSGYWPYYNSRLLRAVGDHAAALEGVHRALDQEAIALAAYRGNSLAPLAERARVYAAMGDWDRAAMDIEQALQIELSSGLEARFHVQMYLFLWLVHEHLGRSHPQEVWQSLISRLRGYVHPSHPGIVTDLLVLASLTGEVNEVDVELALSPRFVRGSADGLMSLAVSMLEQKVIVELMGKMWSTPRGRQIAELLATRQALRSDLMRLPVMLAGYQLCCQRAFQGELPPEQDAVVWQCCRTACRTILDEGGLAKPQLVQLALTWKGITNALGWEGVAAKLAPPVRAEFAYVFGHRLLALGKPQTALELLRTALADAPPDSPLASLARVDIQLVEREQGRLVVEGDTPGGASLIIQGGNDQPTRLSLDAARSLDLPAGRYTLDLDADSAQGVLVQTSMRITSGRHHVAHVQSLENDGAKMQRQVHRNLAGSSAVLPIPPYRMAGLLANPKRLPGLQEWQMETIAARSLGGNVSHPHHAELRSVAGGLSWGADSMRIASAAGRHIRLHDADSLRLQGILCGGDYAICAMSWSPNGTRLASSDGSLIRLLEVPSGRQKRVLNEHTGRVTCLAWNPIGTVIASGAEGADRRALTWSANGDLTGSFGGMQNLRAIAWSPDGTHLVCGGQFGMKLWNVAGRKLEAELPQPVGVHRVAWSPDGKWLLSADMPSVSRPTVRLWNTATWQVQAELSTLDQFASSLSWRPDSTWFATAGPEGTFSIWTLDGSLVRRVQGHQPGFPMAVAWSPDGKRIASSSSDGLLCVWNAEDASLLSRLGHPEQAVRALAWGPGESSVTASVRDGTVRSWDVRTSEVQNLPSPMEGSWEVLVPSHDGRQIAAGSGSQIQLWANPWNEPQASLSGHEGPVTRLCFSHDNEHLASAGADRKVCLWDSQRGALAKTWTTQENILSLAVSADAKWIAAGLEGGKVQIFDCAAGTSRRLEKLGSQAVCFSPDDKWLACTGGWNEPVRLVSTEDWQRKSFYGKYGKRDYHAVNLSPDGRWLAMGGKDGAVELCSLEDGREWTLHRGCGTIRTLAFSPDGSRLASAGDGQVIRIWDVAMREEQRAAVLLPDKKAAVLDAEGLLSGATDSDLQRHFVYLSEEADGSIKLLTHAEFRKREEEAGKASRLSASQSP